MMIFDTDILIWVQRGNSQAAKIINCADEKFISIFTYMEMLQCPQNKKQHKYTKEFLHDFNFKILSLSHNIGTRAAVYVEEYSMVCGITASDAVIAATAVEHDYTLCSGNVKHFKLIKDLKFKAFKPV